MATVIVNNSPVDIGDAKINLVQAADKAGVLIPHYCWHAGLSVVASCRMCLVEVGEKKPDGTVAMQPKVVPACQTPAKDNTVVVTDSPKAKAAQAQTLEGLLLNHPLDCPVCDKAGECKLQDYSHEFGTGVSRLIDDKNTPPNKPNIGEHISLFTDRCIMCSRCVRFTREVSGSAELQVINRGTHAEIDVFPGEPVNNKLAGNVVDLCPVGALANTDFLYKQRVWYLKPHDSVCADCSTGCSVSVDSNKDIVYRLRPRENMKSQGYFMCDDGRFGFHYTNSEQRFRVPQARRDGGLVAATWQEVAAAVRKDFAEAVAKDPAGVVGVLSPFLTCEEAFLLASWLKGLSPAVTLALGPVPVVGQDDQFPKNRRGDVVPPVKFTIRAEKCPNRRGVEAVLTALQGRVIPFDEAVRSAADGKFQAAYIAAGYPPRPGGWVSGDQAAAFARVPVVVLHDLLPSPLVPHAKYLVPGATFAEKDGTFVNYKGLAQAIHRAAKPPEHLRTDGQVFLDLAGRRGLIHAPTVRKEAAGAVPYLAPLAGDLGADGVFLEAPRMAESAVGLAGAASSANTVLPAPPAHAAAGS